MRIKAGIFPSFEIRRDLELFIHNGHEEVAEHIPNGIRCEIRDDPTPDKPYGDEQYDRMIAITFNVNGYDEVYMMRSWEIVQV